VVEYDELVEAPVEQWIGPLAFAEIVGGGKNIARFDRDRLRGDQRTVDVEFPGTSTEGNRNVVPCVDG
jgi:hypothetical protein